MTPATPRGIRSASAASGPYAAELSASRPKIGIPASAPSFSPLSSEDRRGRPNRKSMTGVFDAPFEAESFCCEAIFRVSSYQNAAFWGFPRSAGHSIPTQTGRDYCGETIEARFGRARGYEVFGAFCNELTPPSPANPIRVLGQVMYVMHYE